jgi:hypothetical protein
MDGHQLSLSLVSLGQGMSGEIIAAVIGAIALIVAALLRGAGAKGLMLLLHLLPWSLGSLNMEPSWRCRCLILDQIASPFRAGLSVLLLSF